MSQCTSVLDQMCEDFCRCQEVGGRAGQMRSVPKNADVLGPFPGARSTRRLLGGGALAQIREREGWMGLSSKAERTPKADQDSCTRLGCEWYGSARALGLC